MIIAFALVIILVTYLITKLAGRAKVTPGMPNKLQYVAIAFWFISIVTVVVVVVYYLNVHGINFAPKPIKL